jgi:hypothetical protein
VTSESVTIRFPSGAWEYAVTERLPDVGDTLLREGTTWMVAAVGDLMDNHRGDHNGAFRRSAEVGGRP